MYTNDDIMDKLNELELKIDNIESKVDSLDNNLKKHIKFIDKTYEGLKNRNCNKIPQRKIIRKQIENCNRRIWLRWKGCRSSS